MPQPRTKSFYHRAAALSALLLATPFVAAEPSAKLAFTKEHIRVDTGAAGAYELSYPQISDKKSGKTTGPAQIDVQSESAANLIYADGAKAALKIDGGRVNLAFSDVPSTAKSFKLEMMLPMAF